MSSRPSTPEEQEVVRDLAAKLQNLIVDSGIAESGMILSALSSVVAMHIAEWVLRHPGENVICDYCNFIRNDTREFIDFIKAPPERIN